MALNTRQKMLFFVLFPLVLQFVGLAGVIRLELLDRSVQQEAARSYQLISNATLLEKLMVDAETGTRGFIATSDERFLEPYLAARESVPGVLEQVARSLSVERRSEYGLGQNVVTLLGFRERQVEQIMAGTNVTAQNLLEGKAAMDMFRADVARLIRDEQARLERRRAAVGRAGDQELLLLAGMFALNLLLVPVLWNWFSENFRSRFDTLLSQARLLHESQPLNRPMTSSDEFAEIDQALVEASDSIQSTTMALIAEREEAEARAQSRAQFIDRLLQSTSSLALVLNADGRIVRASDAFVSLAGLDARTLRSLTIWEVAADNPVLPTVRQSFEQALLGQFQPSYEWPYLTPDGEERIIVWRATPLLSVDGLVDQILATGTDITEQRRSEARERELDRQVKASDRVESLGRTAAKVAHEFNNVLMGIQPQVDVLRKIGTSDPRAERAIEQIRKAVQRGAASTQSILRFARPARLQLKPVSLQTFLSEHDWSSAVLPHSDVEIRVEGEAPAVMIDHNQIGQVIVNLLLNASQAMPDGGTVTIHARRAPANASFSFGVVDNSEHFAWLSVTDQGIGIPSEIIDRIFEPFFTTKASGNGIGLAVCHQVVRSHEGHMFVESQAGVGTTIHLFLPIASSAGADAVDSGSVVRANQTAGNRNVDHG